MTQSLVDENIEKAIVVACANDGVIGKDNAMPWHLPADLQHFKRVTLGHPLIMGRKTFESIGRPLPGRTTFVITRQSDWQVDGVIVCHSLEDAYKQAENEARTLGVTTIMIVGGAEFYRQALPDVTRIYLTEIDLHVGGDAFFPKLDGGEWDIIRREHHSADAKNVTSYSFCELIRR